MRFHAQLSVLFALFALFLTGCTQPTTTESRSPTATTSTIPTPVAVTDPAPTVTQPSATVTTATSPTDTIAPTEAPAEPATAAATVPAKTGDMTVGTVTIPGTDGLALAGTFQAGSGEAPRPTLLLLHMLGADRSDWQTLATTLNEAGYNTLALDMRGHGDTGGARDWELAAADHVLVWQYLAERPDVDPTRIGVIGGSIGANMTLRLGAAVPQIPTIVLLSPGLNYDGVMTEPEMAGWGDRPVFIVASSEDSYAADSSTTLASLATHNSSTLHLYDGAGHGTAMLRGAPDLTQRILAWLETNL